MKRDYIILTYTLGGIGGGQIYCRNKTIFLNKNNYNPIIFASKLKADIVIDELKKYAGNTINELLYPPYFFSAKRQEKVIAKIIGKLETNNDFKDLIIECNTINTALWGELLAKKLNCKNFIYLISEIYSKKQNKLPFLDFKHQRKELAAINKKALPLLFEGFKTLEEEKKYFLNACVSNVAEDADSDIINNIKPMDINIACISRLEKPQIKIMVDEVVRFANKFEDKKIQFILIGSYLGGDAPDEMTDKLKSAKNIFPVYIKSLYPIPRSLFDKAEVFLAVSGSAKVCQNEGALTVIVDKITGKPGILGYDTDSTLYSDNGIFNSVSEVLEYLYIKNNLKFVKSKLSVSTGADFMVEYNNHLDFINSSEKSKIYYNVQLPKNGFKEAVSVILIRLFGLNVFETVRNIYGKILKMLKKSEDKYASQ